MCSWSLALLIENKAPIFYFVDRTTYFFLSVSNTIWEKFWNVSDVPQPIISSSPLSMVHAGNVTICWFRICSLTNEKPKGQFSENSGYLSHSWALRPNIVSGSSLITQMYIVDEGREREKKKTPIFLHVRSSARIKAYSCFYAELLK